jgi:hypothetical protein
VQVALLTALPLTRGSILLTLTTLGVTNHRVRLVHVIEGWAAWHGVEGGAPSACQHKVSSSSSYDSSGVSHVHMASTATLHPPINMAQHSAC